MVNVRGVVCVFAQWFTEDSNELWRRHCQRDFKRETPQEYESWREMYLRLHDEREVRLRRLTQNISMAHANKPKGDFTGCNITFFDLKVTQLDSKLLY